DAVVDGLDNMKTRYSVNRACIEQGIPYIFGSAISTFGNVSTIIPKETACLECFYGNLDDTLLPSCATVGVHQSAISIVASVQVAETLKMLLGKKSKLRNKLLYIDIESMRFEEINVVRAPSCPVCGEGRFESSPPPSRRLLIEETCGRNRNRVYIVIPREDLKLGMKKLTASLEAEGKQLDVKARLGVTFTADNNVRVSLLKSGIMILEGAETQEEALDLYEKNVLKRMNIPWI
ncbi:MAG: ThiF family adenylyltransferase, partial [Candidatus Bathyarchaeota archaeon]